MEKPPWAAMLRLDTLAPLARPHVLGNLDVLAHPKGEAPYQRSCFGAPEVSPERAVVALAEHLRPQPATGGDAESVSLALPAAVQQAAAHQERPALRSVGGGVKKGGSSVRGLASIGQGKKARIARQRGEG